MQVVSDTEGATGYGILASLVVIPTPVTLSTGATTYTFEAVGFDVFMNPVAVTPVWSIVEGGTDATINSSTGVLTTGIATQEEVVTVRATVGAIVGNATVTIEDIVLDRIVTNLSSWSMTVGDTKQFTAIGYTAADAVVAITPVWSKVSGVGSINASTGLYTAGTTSGAAVLRATVGAETDDIAIVVEAGAVTVLSITPANTDIEGGQQQVYAVAGLDAYGNTAPLNGNDLLWSVSGGGTLTSFADTATFWATPSATTTVYDSALSVTYQGLVGTTSFTVIPGGT